MYNPTQRIGSNAPVEFSGHRKTEFFNSIGQKLPVGFNYLPVLESELATILKPPIVGETFAATRVHSPERPTS